MLIKPVHAAITNPVLKDSAAIQTNPFAYANSTIQVIISIFFIFGLIYFFYHFVLSGYNMMASQGDPKKYEDAKHGFTFSLIGIALIFSIFAILKIIGTIFGITGLDNLTITWPTI